MAVPCALVDHPDGAFFADLCEGCGVRDDGRNFAHEGLCKLCNASILGASTDELLSHTGDASPLAEKLLKNAAVRAGAFTSWSDDAGEVEVALRLPPGTTARELDVAATSRPRPTLNIARTTAGTREPLLVVDPLAGDIVGGADEVVWYLDDGVAKVVLTKLHAGLWGDSLGKRGGTLEVWPGGN